MTEQTTQAGAARIVILIPAHNEQESIASVLGDLKQYCPQADVVVIDDASDDATASLAGSLDATVLSLPCNLGVGGAMQTGYKYAAVNGYDIAVQFDGDGQHRANRIEALLDAITQGGADLAIGSRLISGLKFRFHPLRFIGNRLLSLIISAICRQKITDPTSGFRAAGGQMIRFFARHYPQTYLGDTAEALVEASRHGMNIAETSTRMNQRQSGQSAAGSLKGFWLTMQIILAVLIDCIESPIDVNNEETS